MADLDAARLDDVKHWFRDHYGPNNAVITLSGDIDEATARRLVTRYFGDIPAGPRTAGPVAPVPTLPRDVDDRMTDRVAAPMIVRAWAMPGQLTPDHAPLEAVGTTLGQMATSTLQDRLVRREKLFTEINVGLDGATQGSTFLIQGIVADGIDPASAGRRMDAVIAGEKERLGARLDIGINKDRTVVDLTVPSINFPGALDLMAAITRHPTFADGKVVRKRTELLAQIQQELTDPQSIGARLLPLLTDPGSPYAKDFGSGDPAAVARLTRADLVAFYRAWFRPDKAKLFVVSDRPLAELRPLLERAYGGWTATGPAGTKVFPATTPRPQESRIVLVDQPDASQSLIGGLVRTPLRTKIPMDDAQIANDALGGGFASRISTDLRERRHWTYGANASFISGAEAVSFSIIAPVQPDRTGDAIAVMRDQLTRFVTSDPITQAEFDRAVDTNVKSSLSAFSSPGGILAAMKSNDRYGRPDDYATTLPGLYRALTLDRVRTAFRTAVDPAAVTWLVIGDAASIRPQLATLGLPIEERTPLGTPR